MSKTIIPGFIRKSILSPLRRIIGSAFYESGKTILGIKDSLVPPARINVTGYGDYRAIGYKFLQYFIEYGGLKKDDKILDIGSGFGRMALPLMEYLEDGSYEGIDTITKGVKWSQDRITTKNSKFRFQHADIYNKLYNKSADTLASEYRFPYDDNSFDFIFLTSVFTHLMPQDTENYVREISRMLKPEGTLFSTWFLLTDESKIRMQEDKKLIQFVHPVPGDVPAFAKYKDSIEEAIAYDDAWLKRVLKEAKLTLSYELLPGSWSKAPGAKTMQDIVVVKKSLV